MISIFMIVTVVSSAVVIFGCGVIWGSVVIPAMRRRRGLKDWNPPEYENE